MYNYIHIFCFLFRIKSHSFKKFQNKKLLKLTNGLTGFKHKLTILESILTLLLLAVHFIIISILAACVLKNSVFQMFWLEHNCSFHKLYVLKMISHEIFLLLILKMLWLYKKIFIIVINRSIAFSRTLKFSPHPLTKH